MNATIDNTLKTITLTPLVLSYMKTMIVGPDNNEPFMKFIRYYLNDNDVDKITSQKVILAFKTLNDEKWVSHDANVMGFLASILIMAFKLIPSSRINQIITDSLEDIEDCKSLGIFTEKTYLKHCRYLIHFAVIHQNIQQFHIDEMTPKSSWILQSRSNLLHLKFPVYFNDIYHDDPLYNHIRSVEQLIM